MGRPTVEGILESREPSCWAENPRQRRHAETCREGCARHKARPSRDTISIRRWMFLPRLISSSCSLGTRGPTDMAASDCAGGGRSQFNQTHSGQVWTGTDQQQPASPTAAAVATATVMTITPAVQRQFFDADSNRVIYLPSRKASSPAMIESITAMSISGSRPHQAVTSPIAAVAAAPAVVLPVCPLPTTSHRPQQQQQTQSTSGSPWTEEEHARFLLGLDLFPSGPWKAIAGCVGTRTARQTMSHAQKYRQKIGRRQRQKERQNQRLRLVYGAQNAGHPEMVPPTFESFCLSLGIDQDATVSATANVAVTTPTASSISSGSDNLLDVAEFEKELLVGSESPLLLLTDDALAQLMTP